MDKYQARKIRCKQCGALFVFSAEEQRYFDWKLWDDPIRCHTCRTNNRIRHETLTCIHSNGCRRPRNIRQQHYRRYGGS